MIRFPRFPRLLKVLLVIIPILALSSLDDYESLPNIIEENEYLSNREYDENNILKSKFGEKEYECNGNCYCENSERITSTNVITNGISYFLVSISLIAAYQKSKSYFDSKCTEKLSNECQQSTIISSVENCYPVVEENTTPELYRRLDTEERRRYFCYGNCVKNLQHKKKSTIEQFEHIYCDKLKREGEVEILQRELMVRSSSSNPSQKFRLTARHKFAQTYLVDYCKYNSRMEYFLEGTTTSKKGKKYPFKEKYIGSSCVGRSIFGGIKSKVKNIRCRQIDPAPTNSNWKWRLQKWEQEKEDWDMI